MDAALRLEPVTARGRWRRLLPLVALVSNCMAASAGAQIVAPPHILGRLAGPGAVPAPPGVRMYGLDLGWTFVHRGQHLLLFGDTWAHDRVVCEATPANDDAQATLPLGPPVGVPPVTFFTRAGAPDELETIVVRRGGTSLPMGYGRVPIAAFSDGVGAFGIFGRPEWVACGQRSPRRRPSCRPHAHLSCASDVGECTPELLTVPLLCDLATGAGCLAGQTCTPADGYCIDPTSSQDDGTPASARFRVAQNVEIAAQNPARPTEWDSVAVLASNKFFNATARTVTRFTRRRCGSDYRAGTGALLVWGRPGFNAEQGRQAQLYLMTHPLPLRRRASERTRFRPAYFAGLDGKGQPRWSRRESRARPLALDGVVGGSPREEQPIVNQMAIGWVGEPVDKWMMLYGGDVADYLLLDAAHARPGDAPGAIRIRFADHPWGPWSVARPHLRPGSPSVVGDPYGPGGVLFHVGCTDQGAERCAPSDPHRPPDAVLAGCPEIGRLFDNGRLYGPNIIDAWTRPDGAGGVDVLWNVSTWNPYGVALLKTNVRPEASAASSCSRRRP